MTNEERDLIRDFISRVGGASAAGGFASSVPATQPALPPVDREADALIADLFARLPEARYRITQMAFVQEHALAAAQNQISHLQWELQNLRNQQQQQQQQQAPGASPWGEAAQPQPSRGFFGGLFGGRSQQSPPRYQQQQYQPSQYQQPQYAPPPPQYAPGYQPGMFQQRGSGFLGSALTTAAGVAGGMVAGHALMNLFSGGHGGGFGSMASAPAMPMIAETPASPWAAPAGESYPSNAPYETGGATKDMGSDNAGGGWQQAGSDQGGWQQPASDPGGWQDASNDQGWQDASGQDAGGWDDAGGSDPDNT